jgi:hypothetical protein
MGVIIGCLGGTVLGEQHVCVGNGVVDVMLAVLRKRGAQEKLMVIEKLQL